MPNCLPLFSSCKGTSCYTAADVNKDGVLDAKDLKESTDKLAKVTNFDSAVAKDTFEKFCSKVEKVTLFLEAAKILFATDPVTVENIDKALLVLKLFTLAKQAITDVGTQVTAALSITNVGETITDVQRTSASIQAYLRLFQDAGINVGFKPDQFKEVDAALNRIDAVHKLWSALNTASSAPAPVLQ